MNVNWDYIRHRISHAVRPVVDLPAKLDPAEFGGGRVQGVYMLNGEIQQCMCSVQGCGRRAHATWSGCADENIYRPLCPEHDVQLNLIALVWWGDPQREEKMSLYVRDMERDIERPVEAWAYDPEELYAQLLGRLRP